MNTRYFLIQVICFGIILAFLTGPVLAKSLGPANSVKAVETREILRDLWSDHIFWVRSVVMSTKYGDTEAAKIAEANVVDNAKAIADSIIPFYGKAAGDKLFELLAGHYGAVKNYMTAAFSNDKAGMDKAREDLVANADAIAAFLSSANPNWPKATLNDLLMMHGAHHIDQINEVAGKDFTSEAMTWSSMKKHMNMIADALAIGIVKQFPKKFK